jgi:voltage-gated potassium channel
MLRRLIYALTVFVAVVVIGTAGYMLIGGWSLLDALYMTIITMGGVGFREVHPLTQAGQVWTMLVIVSGVGALGFAVITVTDFMVEGHFSGILEGRRMDKRIAGLTGHHVVLGLGRVGSVVCDEFESQGEPFVVIDADATALDRARERDWAWVQGDATEEGTLQAAGIERAASMVAALDTDADNVFAVLTARGMVPGLFIVARATTPSSEDKMCRSGANRVITPTEIGGRRMASMVMRPRVVDFLDIVAGGQRRELKLEEITLSPGDPYVGVTIADAHIRSTTGAYILAIHSADDSVNQNPSSGTVMKAGDRLVVLGSDEQLRTLAEGACVDADVCYPRRR